MSERHKTWDTLKYIRSSSDLPWLCIGDFNEVLHRSEHVGVNERSNAQIAAFRDVVDVCGLMDLGYIGVPWTFEKRVAGGSFCRTRLDRALASPSWCGRYPLATLHHLSAATSDHLPILLRLDGEGEQAQPAMKPFRYEVMWESHEGFNSVLEHKWQTRGSSTSVDEINNKLNQLSKELKRWNSGSFGNVRRQLKGLRAELEEMRSSPGRQGPSHAEIKTRDRIIELRHREEVMWRQRSRIQWLSEGDRNTHFFHQRVSRRKKKNKITSLSRADGVLTEDQ